MSTVRPALTYAETDLLGTGIHSGRSSFSFVLLLTPLVILLPIGVLIALSSDESDAAERLASGS